MELDALLAQLASAQSFGPHSSASTAVMGMLRSLVDERCPDASLASTSGFLTRFCASLPPDLRVSLLNCASRELAASVQRCYRLGDGWAVLIAADASEARQIAMQIALRRRFPLLQTEGCRALTRSPVFYGDRETFADVERWAWTSLLTRDSFCAVERTHRPIHSELLHRAAIAPALPLPASAPTDNAPAPRLTELINMYAMDAEQLEAEIAHDRTHGRLPTAVCLQVGGDRSVAHLSPHGDAQSDVPRPLRGIIPRWASASSGEFHVTPAWSGLEDGATICESEGRHTPVSQPDDVLVQSLVSDELRRASAAMGDACFWQDQAEDIRQLCDRNNIWCHLEGSLLSIAAAPEELHECIHAPVVLSCADSLTLQPLSFVGFDSPVALLAVRNTSDHSSATLPPVASLADPVRGSLQLINTLLVYLFAFAPRSFPPRRGLSAIALAPPPMLGLGIQPADSFTSISAAHELTGSSSILERHPHATDTEIGSTLPLPLESVVAFSPTVAMAEDVLALVRHFRNALLRQSPHFTVAFGASSVLLPHVLAFRVHAAPCVAPADESLTANIGMKDTTAFQFLLARQLQSWCVPLHLECEVLPSTLAPTVAMEFDPVVAVQPSPAIFDASNPPESVANKLSRRMDSAIFQVPALAVAPLLVDETPRERSAGWFVFRPTLWPQRRSDNADRQPSYFDRTAALIDAFVDALTLHVQLLSRCVELRPHFERALLASSPDFEIVPFAELAHSEEVLASEHQRQPNDSSVSPVPLIGLGAFRSVPALLAMRPAAVAHQGGQRSATPTFDGDPILDVFNDALATALFNVDGSTLFRVAETRGGALCIVISAQLPIESPSSSSSRHCSESGRLTALSAATAQPEPMGCNGVIGALESTYVGALVAFIEHTARHLDLPPSVAHAMETALQRGIREAEARLQSLASTAVTPALPSRDSATRSTGGLGQIVSSVWSWFAPAAPADPAVSSADAVEQGVSPIAGTTGQHFDIRFGFDSPIGASAKSAPEIGASSSKMPAS